MSTVRGERVTVLKRLGPDERPTPGILGATVSGVNVLVEYPDGELGYVRESDLQEEAA